jgi:hypothetical protein
MAWTSNTDLIQKLYIAYYGRPADPGGLRYWASQLPDNATPDSAATRELISRFINSQESQDRFGSPSLDSAIARIYTYAFHRDATNADKALYTGKTVVDVLVNVISVSSGPDYASLNNKLEYAKWFTAFLDPNGDGLPNDDSTGTKFYATFYGNTDATDIAAKLNSIDAANPAVKSNVLNDVISIADPGDAIKTNPPSTGQTFTLTTDADAFTGTAGNDTFVATEATLSSADVIDGGDGNDLFRYASSGNAAVNEAGFEIKNVETVQITSDAVNGTTFDFTGTQGVQTIRNFNSSQDLTLTGLKTLAPTIEIDSIGAKDRATSVVDTTIVYDVAATKGTADAVQINLSGNLNTDGSRVGKVTVDGIEIFNVKSSGSASAFDELASNTLREMNITGNANLTLAGAVFNNTAAVNTVNAKDFTGNLNITLTNSGAANIDVAVTGGKGNDRADFSAGFDKNDAFDGGDGTDTLALTNGVAVVVNPANFGTVKNVEILEITDGGTNVGASVLDLNNFPGVSTVYYSGLTESSNNGLVGNTNIQNVASGFTVKVNNPNGKNLTTTIKTDGASDVLNLQVEKVATAGENLNVVSAILFETVNLSVTDDAEDVGVGTFTINQLVINNATTLNITGSAHLVINSATPVLATLNAKDLSGDLTLKNVDFTGLGATITLGSGNDTFFVASANGADTITLGAGKDRVVYNTSPQSNSNMDTITDFVSGTDVIDVQALLGSSNPNRFVGNRPTFAQAQGALTGGGTESAVFQQDEQILWVDVNGDGTLDNRDFRVKLPGVTSLTAADLGLTFQSSVGVTFTANKVGFNTANAADSVENNAVGDKDDVINATVAQLVGATVDGKNGFDVLNITGTAAPNEIADLQTITFTNVETVNLDSSVEGVKMVAADLGSGSGKTSKINGAIGIPQSLEVNTGTDLSGVAISNIETLIMTGTVTMRVAQHNAFINIKAPGVADQITLSDGGTLTADEDVETYELSNAGNTILLTAAGQNVTGDTDNDTVETNGLAALTGNIDLKGGADTLKVTGASVNISGASLAGIETLDVGNNLNVTLTVAQHNAFTTINAAGTNTFTLTTNGTLTADADVETYVLSSVGANTILLTAAGQNVTGGTDDDTVQTNGLATLTGTISLGSQTTADTLKVTVADVDISGARLAGIETLDVGNDLNVTLTAAQLAAFTKFVGAGTNTVTVTTQATGGDALVVDQTAASSRSVFETFVLQSNANDTATFKLANNSTTSHTIDITAGGADTITLNNVSIDNGTGVVTVVGFGATDVIGSQVAGTSIVTGAYVTADAGNKITNQTSGNVIEIHSLGANGVQVAAPTNDASLLAALNLVLTNGGNASDIANGDYTVIAYNGNNGYVYQVYIAGGNGTAGNDDTVELIGILQNVGADTLTAANFV